MGAEPSDSLKEAFAIGPRDITEFAPRLGVVEEHPVARHSQAVHGDERLATAESRYELSRVGQRIDEGARRTQSGGLATDDLGDVGEHIGKKDVLAAENVALSDLSVAQRREMTGGDVIDMSEIQPRIDESGDATRRR